MRWLILQSDAVNRECSFLRECFSVQRALIKNGEFADVWGLRHDNYGVEPNFNEYDVVLCIENYEIEWLPDFKAMTEPIKMLWIIDLHINDSSIYDALTPEFDIVLHSSRWPISDFEAKHPEQQHIWFPNCYDDTIFTPTHQKPLKPTFVGNMVSDQRIQFLAELSQLVDMDVCTLLGKDMITHVSNSTIHVNHAVNRDLNYRMFETIGLGTVLCTPRVDDIERLGFKDCVNCIIFSDVEECAAKIKMLLRHPDIYEEIRIGGIALSIYHTYAHRFSRLIPVVFKQKYGL